MSKQLSKKICSKCQNDKKLTDFYKSYSPLDADERLRICKSCIQDMIILGNTDSWKDVLRMIDKPFIYHLYESAISRNAPVGEYFKLINAKDFRHMNWEDSIVQSNATKVDLINDSHQDENIYNFELLEDLKEKYGHGYPDNEYLLFEKKFQQLKPSFQLVTTMHEEYLREYCVNKVKETLAKAKGDFKEAKEWAAMAKESAEAGKLKPSQMSKADLSAGLDGFGQLSRVVEEKHELISLLPKFTQQPKDKVDVVLWLYINYIRDLKGLPEVEYKDIWEFYERRREEYEKQELDNLLTIEKSEEDV